MYTAYLGLGHTLLCRTIKSGTIRNYQYQAARLVIEARRKAHQLENPLSRPTWVDPRFDCTGKTDSRITDVLREIEHWERMPERREALTVDMIAYQKLQCHSDTPHSEANVMFDWEVVGIYAGIRLSEWAQDEHVRTRSQVALAIDGSPLAFQIDDLRFFGENRRRMTRADALRSPHLVCSIDLRWRYQKNGNNGELKTFVRARSNPLLCAVSALIRIAQRWVALQLPADHPLAVFTSDGLESGPVTFIRPSHIEFALRSAARSVYNITDASELARFSAHSFRVGACVALHAAGVPSTDIKHALRWKSDTFMMYLRNLPCQAARTAHAVESFNPTRLTLIPTTAVA